jgi:hypothetical protein
VFYQLIHVSSIRVHLNCPQLVCVILRPVYGLNGDRLYYIISLFKVTYKSTIQAIIGPHAIRHANRVQEASYTDDRSLI